MKRLTLAIAICILALLSTDLIAQNLAWEWEWTGGGSGDEYTWDNETDEDGNIYVTGSFSSSSIAFGTHTLNNSGSGTSDIFVVKYDSTGAVIWANSYGTANNDEGRYLGVDDSGNVYITGYYNSASLTIGSDVLTNSGNDDMYVAKLDAAGNEIWAIKIGNVSDNRPEGLLIDLSNYVTVTGGYGNASLVIGTFTLTNAGSFDFFYAQFMTGNGANVFAKGFGGPGDDRGQNLTYSTASGYLYIGGRFDGATLPLGTTTLTNASSGSQDAFIMEINNSNTVTWAKSIGGSSDEAVNGIIHNSGGGANTLFISGEFSSSSIVVGNDTLINAGSSSSDIMLISHTGTSYDWAISSGGSGNDLGTGLTMVDEDEVGFAGVFNSSTISFDNLDLTNTGSGTFDIFVAVIDETGEAVGADKVGGTGDDFGFAISSNDSKAIILSGWYGTPSITFPPLPVSTNSGGNDAFVAVSGPMPVGVREFAVIPSVAVYPNPSSGLFTFENPESSAAKLNIMNTNGQVILTLSTTEPVFQVDLSDVNPGLYYYQITAGETVQTGKLLRK